MGTARARRALSLMVDGNRPGACAGCDVGCDEFEEADAGAFAAGGDESRDDRRQGRDDELVHGYRCL